MMKMRAPTISKMVSITGTVIAGYFAVCLSEIAAVAGAQLGGLQEGGWNWQFLGPLAAGRVLGIAITVLVAVVLCCVTKVRLSKTSAKRMKPTNWTLGTRASMNFSWSLARHPWIFWKTSLNTILAIHIPIGIQNA
jgi:hypothetical protein